MKRSLFILYFCVLFSSEICYLLIGCRKFKAGCEWIWVVVDGFWKLQMVCGLDMDYQLLVKKAIRIRDINFINAIDLHVSKFALSVMLNLFLEFFFLSILLFFLLLVTV